MPLHIRGEKTATTHHPRLSDRRKPSLLMLMMTMVVVFGLLSVSWMQAVVINSAEENNRRIALKEKIKQFKGHTVKTTTTTSSSTGTTNEEEETGEEEAPPPFNIEQEQLAFFHTVKTILNGEYHSISTSVATSILVAACDYVIREAASLDAIQEEDIMQSRPVIDINCSNPDYELALTGETDSEDQKYIIDVSVIVII